MKSHDQMLKKNNVISCNFPRLMQHTKVNPFSNKQNKVNHITIHIFYYSKLSFFRMKIHTFGFHRYAS